MIRFNYRQSRFQQVMTGLPIATVAERLRLEIAVAGTAALILGTVWSIQTHRLATLDGELATVQLRVQAVAPGQTRAEQLIASVARLRAMRERIAAARRDVIMATNTIARIGNELPPQTWLTGVGSTPSGTWTIGGRTTRVDEIGTMLRRVQGLDGKASVRLVSIAATGRTGRILDFVIDWDQQL